MITKNSEVMNADLKFKRTQSDVETLEDMKKYFVAQDPSYCGPASAEMALGILGYGYGQEEIGEACGAEVGEGVEVDDLKESIEELTDGEVKAAFVEYDKITELGEEFKTWFNDGGLIIPNFYKPELFSNASAGHYVLSVGAEGEELLILDPSGTNGGVYYVDEDRMKQAMSEFDHKRGYIVMAPKGTTAHWRLKNNLIYSDKSYYDELSKTLEVRLRKILRQGRIMKNVTPSSIEDYIETWRSDEKLTRVWKPEQSE